MSVSFQQSPQILNHWDRARCQLPVSVSFADEQFRSDPAFRVNIVDFQGASFIDATTAVEADAKQSAIA
jgi:hypothetical protein